jgi:hypothetical protein
VGLDRRAAIAAIIERIAALARLASLVGGRG